jgi:hypothetical protein
VSPILVLLFVVVVAIIVVAVTSTPARSSRDVNGPQAPTHWQPQDRGSPDGAANDSQEQLFMWWES